MDETSSADARTAELVKLACVHLRRDLEIAASKIAMDTELYTKMCSLRQERIAQLKSRDTSFTLTRYHNLESLENVSKNLISSISNWKRHEQILSGILIEVMNTLKTSDKIVKSFALSSYIHRIHNPIYISTENDIVWLFSCLDKDASKVKEQFESIHRSKDDKTLSLPFLWESDLGMRVHSQYFNDGISLTLTYGTLTHRHVYEGILLDDFRRLAALLFKRKPTDPIDKRIQGLTLNESCPWTSITKRPSSISLIYEDILDKILKQIEDLKLKVSSTGLRMTETVEPMDTFENIPEIFPDCGSVSFIFSLDNTKRQKFSLPFIIEHSQGIRAYPLTSEYSTIHFYKNTITEKNICGFKNILNFIQERQQKELLYLPRNKSKEYYERNPEVTIQRTPSAAKYNPLNELRTVPPPINMANNVILYTNNLNPDIKPIFNLKDSNSTFEGIDVRRIYVKDQSQYLLGLSEFPHLLSDTAWEPMEGGLPLGSQDQVRFIIRHKELKQRDNQMNEVDLWYTQWQQNNKLLGFSLPAVVIEDFRHGLKVGCHSGFKQPGSHKIAHSEANPSHALMFGRKVKHSCYLDHQKLYYTYIDWGSRNHRARLVEDVDLCYEIERHSDSNQVFQKNIFISGKRHEAVDNPSYLFFVDESPTLYESGFKRFTECHLYSLISKYILKYEIVLAMIVIIESHADLKDIHDLQNLERQLRDSAATLIEKQKKYNYIPDNHKQCFSNSKSALNNRCNIANPWKTCDLRCHNYDLSFVKHYERLLRVDKKLKGILRGKRMINWILNNGLMCCDTKIISHIIKHQEKKESHTEEMDEDDISTDKSDFFDNEGNSDEERDVYVDSASNDESGDSS